MTDKLKNFLMDLIDLLKENAFDAKEEYLKNKKDSDYYEGRLFGYWEVFSTIKHQLFAFEIDPKVAKDFRRKSTTKDDGRSIRFGRANERLQWKEV